MFTVWKGSAYVVDRQVDCHSTEIFIRAKWEFKISPTIITTFKNHYRFLQHILWMVEEADEAEDRSVEIM